MKEKVLIIFPSTKLGGAENVLKQVGLELLDKGYFLDFLFLKNEGFKSWEDLMNEESLSLKTYSNFSVLNGGFNFFLDSFLKKKVYKYIFSSHIITNSFLGVLIFLKLLKKEKFVARESTTIFFRFKGIKLKMYLFLYRVGYFNIDMLICQTEEMKNSLIDNLPYLTSRTNIIVNPNPIDLRKNRKILKDNYFQENFIVSAGRLIEEKGFSFLIKSFNEFIKDETINKYRFKLLILGEGILKPDLEKLIIKEGLMDKVILKGYVENVFPYFEKARICVVSSKIEGFPNVLLQMMSKNTKIISTLCAGGIQDIKGVKIVQYNNIFELKDNLKKIFFTDTNQNRSLFDEELSKRTIKNYIKNLRLNES